MNQNKIAVILVNWNSFIVTNDCIYSLKKATYPHFDIIVIDNGSEDGSGDLLLENNPHIILLKSLTNRGYTGGNNLGFEYSIRNGYTYSMLLNNDTFVEVDFLEPLVNYMDLHPNTGVIQSKIYFNHNRKILWSGGSFYNQFWGFAYTSGLFKKTSRKYEQIRKVDWVTGCSFFTRNEILKKSGLLAENMFIYSEDVDLSFRIGKLGFDLIYHPDSIIYHIAGASGKSKNKGKEGYLSPKVHYLNIRNRIWLIKKHTPWYYIPTVYFCNFFYCLAIMCYFAFRFRFKKLKAAWQAVKDGISGNIVYQ